MSEVAHIPQLRFPEFGGEWEENKLGDIATFSKGKGISKSDIDNDGQLECVRYGELYTTYNELIKDVHSKTNVSKEDVKLSQIGDVIIPASGETAIDIATASCVLKDGVAIGGDLNIIRSDIDGVFNAYYLNNKNKRNVARLSQGSSVIHLYPKHLEILKINLPTKPEQQKIAAFLSAVDNKIEQLNKKKALLGEYKKGVMQQIFSQAIRFKADDGSELPDWEEKKLGDVINTIKNGTSINQNSSSSGYQVTRIETISTGKINLNKVGYVDTDEDLSGYKLQYGDILFSNINSPAHIGKVAYVGREMDLYHGMNLLLIRVNHTILNPEFLYLFLIRKNTRQYFQRICNKAVNQASINQTDLKKTPIIFPGLEEQTKIANFLSSIDNKIEQVGKQLDESKEFKKALLQQMFV